MAPATGLPRFRPVPEAIVRRVDSGAVPLSECEPGKAPFCVVFPTVLDQLDFGVQVSAARLGEQPERFPDFRQANVLLVLVGDSGAGGCGG